MPSMRVVANVWPASVRATQCPRPPSRVPIYPLVAHVGGGPSLPMTSWALPAPGGWARPVSLRPYSVDDSSDVGWVVLGDPCVPHVMWSEQTISPSECVSFLEHVTIQIASTA